MLATIPALVASDMAVPPDFVSVYQERYFYGLIPGVLILIGMVGRQMARHANRKVGGLAQMDRSGIVGFGPGYPWIRCQLCTLYFLCLTKITLNQVANLENLIQSSRLNRPQGLFVCQN